MGYAGTDRRTRCSCGCSFREFFDPAADGDSWRCDGTDSSALSPPDRDPMAGVRRHRDCRAVGRGRTARAAHAKTVASAARLGSSVSWPWPGAAPSTSMPNNGNGVMHNQNQVHVQASPAGGALPPVEKKRKRAQAANGTSGNGSPAGVNGVVGEDGGQTKRPRGRPRGSRNRGAAPDVQAGVIGRARSGHASGVIGWRNDAYLFIYASVCNISSFISSMHLRRGVV
ncbi:hypothetical protein C8R43DRAFT_1130993 [Mycena crocata]|nr:hypothetical protein C8R43DRAFT_1130993 [Mycena crocata]